MKIHFGLHLDGQRGWRSGNLLGETHVGPQGLLNILETQLGLLALPVSAAERVVQYRQCLKALDNSSRFYHCSLATDELGTAATLLEWRDQWCLQGWNGSMDDAAPQRLRDLAAVEQLAVAQLAPSLGERLALVLAALEIRQPDLELVLHDPLEGFPVAWQAVLTHLRWQAAVAPAPEGRGFLGELQTALAKIGRGEAPGKLNFVDDGSVQVVRAETKLLAGRWLAAQLGDAGATTVVASSDGERLDDLLATAGQARLGLRESSAFRPALQVLPLAMETLWAPLDFFALLKFLTHPVCPVPARARRLLADKLSASPGIGGESWQATLARIEEQLADDPEQQAQVREKIAFWVEHERYSPKDGAPVAVLIERAERLAVYFATRMRKADQSVEQAAFGAGLAQCAALVRVLGILSEQAVPTIGQRQLQQLLVQVTARGSENPLRQAEVGAVQRVSHPAAVIAPCAQVVWWQFGLPALPGNYPWSAAELQALAATGAQLPPVEQLLAQAAQDWLRPVLAAREKLILILPPAGVEVHPLWQTIEAIVKDLPVRSLESLLSARAARGMVAVEHQALPQRRRWWQLPEGTPVPKRGRDSFSSLELLLFNPYHWLLKYPAKLRTSRLLDVSDGFRLLGNLAHGLVERFYLQAGAVKMTDADFERWFSPAFEQLIDEEGAVLRAPGRSAEREKFRQRLFDSIKELRHQLRAAGVVEVIPEAALTGKFTGGELMGYADLLVKKRDGSTAVVDMKWSGINKYPEKLRENRHLQLVTYAEMIRQQTRAWPDVAYYILDQAQLVARDRNYFPEARLASPVDDENTAMLWQRFSETWKWRRQQMDRGLIEVALKGLEASEDSLPPAKGLAMEYLDPAYNEYLALAGWEE